MSRYIRTPQDKQESRLLNQGWKMLGVAGWTHPTLQGRYQTKEQAVAYDLGEYHPVTQEHEKMLLLLASIEAFDFEGDNSRNLADIKEAVYELLDEMGYLDRD